MADDDEIVPLSENLLDFSNIAKTIEGNGFTYSTVSCVGKKIGSIKHIEEYTHLRQIDLSKNAIKDIAPLVGLPHVLQLGLSGNAIKSIAALLEGEPLPLQYLIHLNLSENGLVALPPLTMPALKTANFSKNEIATCAEFQGHVSLEQLDLSENMLTTVEGLKELPSLTTLKLGSNEITDLAGLSGVPVLKTADFSKNQLDLVEAPWPELMELESLNVAGNLCAALKTLEALRKLPKLRKLWVAGNPMCDGLEAPLRHELLICHWNLTELDAAAYTDAERGEAKELHWGRLEGARLAQLKAEEEAAAAAAGDDNA